jgi:hypothetical protein
VRIWETHPAISQLQVTAPDFRDWRNQSRSFDAMAAHTLSAMNTTTLLGQGEPENVHGAMATSNLFPTMGVGPILGRSFTDAEERAKKQVAVIMGSSGIRNQRGHFRLTGGHSPTKFPDTDNRVRMDV